MGFQSIGIFRKDARDGFVGVLSTFGLDYDDVGVEVVHFGKGGWVWSGVW